MDGVHDMAGMHGFGPVDPQDDPALSLDDWKSRMFGVQLSCSLPGGLSGDWVRHVTECIPPAVYLSGEYFDRWYRAVAAILLDAGWVTLEELASGRSAASVEGLDKPLSSEQVPAVLRIDDSGKRPAAGTPRFAPGQTIRAITASPLGHTRLPRYLRGRPGRIEVCHGWRALPDLAAFAQEQAEPLYSVSFLARDLWSDVSAPKDRVFAGLWESYLEPA